MADQAAKPETPQTEKQTNCPACNKPIKKLRRYYRNAKYYCTKKCWLKSTKKALPDSEQEKAA